MRGARPRHYLTCGPAHLGVVSSTSVERLREVYLGLGAHRRHALVDRAAQAPQGGRVPGRAPARSGAADQWYADKHGTVDGYLLRHPGDPTRTSPHYHIANQWKRIKQAGQVDIPEGMVVCGLRHFFASNCLTHGMPITDVAEWMGHKTIEITFKIYRHLMPGSISTAAKILNLHLAA